MKATRDVQWASFRSTIKHTILWETAENKEPQNTHLCLPTILEANGKNVVFKAVLNHCTAFERQGSPLCCSN